MLRRLTLILLLSFGPGAYAGWLNGSTPLPPLSIRSLRILYALTVEGTATIANVVASNADFGGGRVRNVGWPSITNDAATKAYVDAVLNSRVFTDDVVLSAGVPVGVAHGLGSDRVVVQVYSGGVLAECDVTVDSVDSVVVESSVDILVAAVNIMSVAAFVG